jgi:hypothetical protein
MFKRKSKKLGNSSTTRKGRKSRKSRKGKKTRKLVKTLTRKKIRGGEENTEENTDFILILDTCPICMDEIQPAENKTITACNHVFHTDCLERWVRRERRRHLEPTCPICRAPIEMDLSASSENENYVIENLRDNILNDNSDESFLQKVTSFLMDKEVMEFTNEQGNTLPFSDNRRFSKLLADIYRRAMVIRQSRGREWYLENTGELQETLRYYRQVFIQGTPENRFFQDNEYEFQRTPSFNGFIEYMSYLSSEDYPSGGARKTRKKRNHNRGIILRSKKSRKSRKGGVARRPMDIPLIDVIEERLQDRWTSPSSYPAYIEEAFFLIKDIELIEVLHRDGKLHYFFRILVIPRFQTAVRHDFEGNWGRIERHLRTGDTVRIINQLGTTNPELSSAYQQYIAHIGRLRSTSRLRLDVNPSIG